MTTKSTKLKITVFNIAAIILFFIAVAWNIRFGVL